MFKAVNPFPIGMKAEGVEGDIERGHPYLEVVKPSSVLLLVFTALGAMVVATDSYVPEIILLALIAIALGSAAANTLTNYFDRDIDAVMTRTRRRPLPMSRIKPAQNALYLGLALAVASVVLALLVNFLVALFGLLGLVINVLVYNRWLKRRSPANIIVGGFAGGAPVLAGYAAVTNTITLDAILLAALVVLWIPTHIWSLALRYKQDYKVARIPMLPIVIGEQKAIRCIAATSVLLVIFSVILYFHMGLGLIYLGVALISGIAMLCLNIWLFFRSEEKNAWIVFKFSSPYLALLFLAMIVERLLGF
jgi:protoheme IX farnesyltransferase